MKAQAILLTGILFATGCGSDRPEGTTVSRAVFPLPGDVRSLREPPENAAHGPIVDGLSLGIWSEKQKYILNTMMNVWQILTNTRRDSSGRRMPYDIGIHDQDFLLVTDANGKTTKIKGSHPGDGMQGMGFAGGISGILHRHIRLPGTYTLQWKVGKLESNVVTIEVAAPSAN
jgi:hypothetical protein